MPARNTPERRHSPSPSNRDTPHPLVRLGCARQVGGSAPGLSSTAADRLRGTETAAIGTDAQGFEVRPSEFQHAVQPLHQVVIPHIGLLIGDMRDLEAPAKDCTDDGAYDVCLTAAPLPITGAVGSPVNPVAVK